MTFRSRKLLDKKHMGTPCVQAEAWSFSLLTQRFLDV